MEAGGRLFVMLLVVVALHADVVTCRKGPPDNRVEQLELTRVTREVDLASPLVKQKVTMVVENKGSKPVNNVLYVVESQLSKRVGYISAQVSTGWISRCSVKCYSPSGASG